MKLVDYSRSIMKSTIKWWIISLNTTPSWEIKRIKRKKLNTRNLKPWYKIQLQQALKIN